MYIFSLSDWFKMQVNKTMHTQCFVELVSCRSGIYLPVCYAWSISPVNSLWHHGLQPARFLCPWGFSRQEYWNGLPCLPPEDLPNQGLNTGLYIAGRFFTHCFTRKVQYRVGSLSLLQGIFPIQESNRGLLHYWQILYQWSQHGSPYICQ